MLFALPCDRMGVRGQFRYIYDGGRMAERPRLDTTVVLAGLLYGATCAEDSKPLPQCLPDRIGDDDDAWFRDPARSEPGQMLQRDYAERHVLIDGVRVERCIHRCRRIVR